LSNKDKSLLLASTVQSRACSGNIVLCQIFDGSMCAIKIGRQSRH